jgi:toxin ParE1/3/4
VKVAWTAEAEQDRIEIRNYIAADDLQAAIRMDRRFTTAAARLADHPKLGRVGKIPGTRELIAHENYRLVYEIEGTIVYVLAVIHTARQWPPKRK